MSATPALPARFARALSAIAWPVYNPWDESDDEFTPFHADLPAGAKLDEATLRAALGVSARYRLDCSPGGFALSAEDYGEETAAATALLDTIMAAALTDVQRITARAPGVVRVRVWLVGRLGDALVGLRSMSTET